MGLSGGCSHFRHETGARAALVGALTLVVLVVQLARRARAGLATVGGF